MDHPEQNPYAAPTVVADAPADAVSDDVRIRTEHIGCEQDLRSLGWVMVLGGVFVALFAVVLMSRSRGPDSGLLLLSVIVLAMFAQVVAGIGLLMLRRWALAPAIIDSALWLLFVPIGTVIALAALWTLSRSRVAFVLTDEYRALIKPDSGRAIQDAPARLGDSVVSDAGRAGPGRADSGRRIASALETHGGIAHNPDDR